jgi:SAM-dependent methyltransferase
MTPKEEDTRIGTLAASSKMSAEEMASYYTRAHQQALKRDRDDPLTAVIGPDSTRWVNSFTDFAHRLGMKRAFAALDSNWGSLASRSVLDLGCGRGRWSKEYAARGAAVTGVDISEEAITILAKEMPEHCFIARDITALSFPDDSFDVVNSVTVLQHMPRCKQGTALDLAARWLKRGGYLVLFENVSAFDAPHVFPHSTEEWTAMVESTGLKRVYCWGSNFEVLFRLKGRIRRLLRGNRAYGDVALPSTSPPEASSMQRRIKSAAQAVLAGVSFPVEFASQRLQLAKATHSVMIFSK